MKLRTWILVLLVSAMALTVVSGGIAAPHKPVKKKAPTHKVAKPAPVTCMGSVMYVAAHEDDPILFMENTYATDIAQKKCVTVVILTAGDGGLNDSNYWEMREIGLRASLYVSDTQATDFYSPSDSYWTRSDAGIPGHPAPEYTLNINSRVKVIFLNLPDGGSSGTGFQATGNQSLKELWAGTIPYMTTVPVNAGDPSGLAGVYSPSTYTPQELIKDLALLMANAGISQLRVQDWTGTVYPTGNTPLDHADHTYGAMFALMAANQYDKPLTVTGFQDYHVADIGNNMCCHQVSVKRDAWHAYALDDQYVPCRNPQDDSDCVSGYFMKSWWAEYPVATLQFPTSQLPIPALGSVYPAVST